MRVIDGRSVGDAVATDSGAYAPFPLRDQPERWSLVRRTVDTTAGTVVVHHRPGPDPVLLLHGVAGSWTTWTPLLDAAHGFAGRGVVLLDLPGWGASSTPAEPLTVDGAAEVVTVVLDALGVGRVDVVGHSMGAFVALHLAVVLPGRVRSLSLVSPTTTATVRAARHPWRALGHLPAYTLLRGGLLVTGRAALPLLRGLAAVGLLRLLAAPVFTHVRRLDRSVLDAFVRELRPREFTAAARSAARYDTERWRGVRCPVVAVLGRDDVFARPADLDELRAAMPQARTVLLDDCGHFAHVEHPAEVAALLAP